VTANCSIEVLAYITYGSSSCEHVAEGYVKLNGVPVWQGSWCTGNRGVNTLLVDPFNCSVQESRYFNTYSSTGESEAFVNYLVHLVKHGSIVVGVSAGESRYINVANLQPVGVDLRDLKIRGSFGFVVQKGYPAKTVLRKTLTEDQSISNPPHFNATITGINFCNAYNDLIATDRIDQIGL